MKINLLNRFTLLLLIAIATVTNSCNKNEISKDELKEYKLDIVKNNKDHFIAQYRSGNIILFFEAKTINSITQSYLTIKEQSQKTETILKTEFVVNPELRSYKLAVHEDIILEAEKIKNDSDSEKSEDLVSLYSLFAEMILSDERINFELQTVQSLFYHKAVLNTLDRSVKNNSDCECTPHPAYFIGKTGFWCQEDYLINPKAYIQAIDKSGYKMTEPEMKMYNYLQENKSLKNISIDKLLNIAETQKEFLRRVGNVYYKSTNKILKSSPPRSLVKEDCTPGSSLGCCGNYAGCVVGTRIYYVSPMILTVLNQNVNQGCIVDRFVNRFKITSIAL